MFIVGAVPAFEHEFGGFCAVSIGENDALQDTLAENNTAKKKKRLADARNARRRELYAKQKQTRRANFTLGKSCNDVISNKTNEGMLSYGKKNCAHFVGLCVTSCFC